MRCLGSKQKDLCYFWKCKRSEKSQSVSCSVSQDYSKHGKHVPAFNATAFSTWTPNPQIPAWLTLSLPSGPCSTAAFSKCLSWHKLNQNLPQHSVLSLFFLFPQNTLFIWTLNTYALWISLQNVSSMKVRTFFMFSVEFLASNSVSSLEITK